MRKIRLLAVLLPLLGATGAFGQGSVPVDIPYEKFVLDNGLTVIVHEDHKAPIVAVNVWYHVGSKNEPDGKSGFAHLFEHLMFNGTEHYDDDYFKVLERVGATDLNGTTNEDRTNYFQNVPVSALDVALWMESERMGHLLGAISQEKLDEQRGVVQNEKRQGENQPYGLAYNLITESTYPRGHPYAHTVIGSMEDLDAASLEDVQDWFKSYYGPNNAVLVLAGDIDVETAREKVEQHFGAIPPGPPVAKHDVWIAKRTGEHRQVMQDRVPQARVYKVWNVPQYGSPEAINLSLAGGILSSGKTSRFYRRLVYEDQIATDVAAFVDEREIGSQFWIVATARPGVDLSEVERALDEELERFLAEGPAEEELERVKTSRKAGFVRGVERIGGFGGKSDVLAMNQVYLGNPDAYKTTLQMMEKATADEVQQTAREWLSDGVYVLEVHPFPEYQAGQTDVDRTSVPVAGDVPDVDFPELQRTTLSNGMEVILAERHSIPVVSFRLILDAGYAADQFAAPGTADLTMNMIDEGTTSRSALEISEALQMLGASLGSGSNLDVSTVYLSALKENLEPSLDLYADIILNPSFPEAELQRLKQEQIARIQREKVSPFPLALRVFPSLLYGSDHAYGMPFTGSGTEESVEQITREDVVDFHRTWFKPNNATLIVVGDTRMEEIKPLLEARFGKWERGSVPEKNLARVDHKSQQVVYLLDRPGSQQSVILAAHVAPPTGAGNDIALETMNNILGGAFTSRVNMNLREDKHWSYGASSVLLDARGQRPFIVYAPVQSDKTKESMAEIAAELRGITGDVPPTADELEMAIQNQTLSLAGRWETMDAVAGSIGDIVRFDLPDDYFDTYDERVRELGLDAITEAARETIYPDRLVWVVVGDRDNIEAGIRELGFGEVHTIDADGNILGSQGTR